MAGDAIGMGERTVAIGLRASATINQSWVHGTWLYCYVFDRYRNAVRFIDERRTAMAYAVKSKDTHRGGM
jgi:hypothetical protein